MDHNGPQKLFWIWKTFYKIWKNKTKDYFSSNQIFQNNLWIFYSEQFQCGTQSIDMEDVVKSLKNFKFFWTESLPKGSKMRNSGYKSKGHTKVEYYIDFMVLNLEYVSTKSSLL